YAMKNYAPETEKLNCEKAIASSVAWLEQAKPVTNQDHAFRLLGLAWGDAAAAVIRQEARSLAALQRADGGWSQLPAVRSGAYATGEAVFALGFAGRMTVDNPVFRKGVDYLLRTQAIDGSWHSGRAPSGSSRISTADSPTGRISSFLPQELPGPRWR